MVRLLSLLFVLSTVAFATPALACGEAEASETAAVEGEAETLTYAVLSVDKVTCAGCYVPIRQELTAMKGVKTIEEGDELGQLVVGYDKTANLTDAQFKAAIKKAGYDCSVTLTAEKPVKKPAAETPTKQS
jgi:copper chaperone CopZ